MTLEKVTASLGLIAVISGISRMLMAPFAFIWGSNSMPELWAGLIACYLMAVGSLGLYLYQTIRTGVVGLVGCLLLSFSNMITGCLVWSTMLNAQPVDGVTILPIINEVTMLAGIILFSVVSIKARQLPLWASILLLVWPILGFIPALSQWFTLLWGLAYVGLGYKVWRSGFPGKYDSALTL
ncbi:hypothetical protein ACFQ88_30300 [Paenibacillus sp. NPDC056579]|uniref:hypothetical protein n=1 Tax=Paenibacillus sp. NPDC056579 TaxID=3345871 RepID=UPI0036B41131